MAGVVAAAPVLAILLKPIIVPLYQLVGADASMFATTLLACDMGGYPLAMQLAGNDAIGNFAGADPGNHDGTDDRFTIPVALSIISKRTGLILGWRSGGTYHSAHRMYRRRPSDESDAVQD